VALPRPLGVLERDRLGGVDVDRRGSRLRHERVAVEQAGGVAVAHDRERTVERRRQTQRHLDLAGLHERREAATRVAAVRRRERATVVAREGDLHRSSLEGDPRVAPTN
jgi:hypothetical protein